MSKLVSKGMGLYIHIPFCMSKCVYCDFLSFEGTDADLQARYVRALIAEMRALHSELDAEVDTVYLGGGTPTALPSPLLCEILNETRHFNLLPGVEVTLEMNPCTSLVALADFAACGVNRLSIGLQAWQDSFLAALGRAHTSDEFTETMQAARAAGIDNINVDLMFGLPGQDLGHWRESVMQVISHNPTHVSAYSLTPAEGTPLWGELEAGRTVLPHDDVDRAMYHEAIRMLAAAGYEHYELSNFAKPGRESRHNVNCWLRKPYIGLGLGAHSFDGGRRWCNTPDMRRYLSAIALREDIEVLSTSDAMAETMILGLRMTKGVSLHDFHKSFGVHLTDCYGSELEMLISRGLLQKSADRVALTPLGLDLANQVFEAFL